QRAKHRGREKVADDMPPTHRRGKATVQNRAFGRADMDRAKATFIVRDMRRNRALEWISGIGHAISKRDIDAAVTLRRGTSIIDEQIRALHSYCNFHRDRLIEPVHMNFMVIDTLR